MNISALRKMDAVQLLELRAQVNAVLGAKVATERKDLQTKLAKLEGFDGGRRRGRLAGTRRAHPLSGKTLPPKYRGPDGATWTGRGLKPKWLTAQLDLGHQLEDFAIAAGPRRKAKKTRK